MEAPQKTSTETSYMLVITFNRELCTFEKAMKISEEFICKDCVFRTCKQFTVGNEYRIALGKLPSKAVVNAFQGHVHRAGAKYGEVYLSLLTTDGYVEEYEPIDLCNQTWDCLPTTVRRAEQPKLWFEE